MTEKVRWEDILPVKKDDCEHYPEEVYSDQTIDECLKALKKAEAEGKICINPPESVFINHIKSHLKEGEVVICKICGKDVAEIYAEHLLSQGG